MRGYRSAASSQQRHPGPAAKSCRPWRTGAPWATPRHRPGQPVAQLDSTNGQHIRRPRPSAWGDFARTRAFADPCGSAFFSLSAQPSMAWCCWRSLQKGVVGLRTGGLACWPTSAGSPWVEALIAPSCIGCHCRLMAVIRPVSTTSSTPLRGKARSPAPGWG